MSKDKVVIIGGGCAGLSAAYTLKKQGREFVLLEATDRCGGRVGNRTNGEFTWGIGAGMTEPQWRTTFQYLDELGLMGNVQKVSMQTYGFWNNEKKHFVTLGAKDTPLQIVKFLLGRGLPFKVYPQLLKLLRLIAPYRKQIEEGGGYDFSSLAEISQMSTEEFGRKYVGDEITDRILNPFLGTMVLARARDVSVAHPIALLSLMQGMCALEGGGIALLTDTLYDKVKDSVQLSTPVEEIIIREGKVVGVRTASAVVEATEVICATDAEVARKILPDLPKKMDDLLSTVKYSSTYNYIFGLNRRIVPDHYLSLFLPASANSIISSIYDENSGVFGKRAPDGAGLMHVFTAGWHDELLKGMTEEARRRTIIRELQKFYPEFPDEPLFTDMIRWDKAVCLEAPGQHEAMEKLINNHMNDVPGLHLAGEYLFLISSTEGAFDTGRKAAEAVLAG